MRVFIFIILFFNLYADIQIISDELLVRTIKKNIVFNKNVKVIGENWLTSANKAEVFFTEHNKIKNILMYEKVVFSNTLYKIICDKASGDQNSLRMYGDNIYIYSKSYKCRVSNGKVTLSNNSADISGKILFVTNGIKLCSKDAKIIVNSGSIETVYFLGDIYVLYNNIIMKAETAEYLPKLEKFNMKGNVIVLNKGSILRSDRLEVNVRTKSYKFLSNITGDIKANGK